MNKNDSEKEEKSSKTIEITIPVTLGDNKGSTSSDNGMSNMKSKNNEDDDSKKGQMSNKSDSSDSDDDTSKKTPESNKVDESNISVDATSEKGKLIINISEN